MKPRSLDRDRFDELTRGSGVGLISIYIPTHQKGRDVAQDPIRLKNQLAVVEERLESLGWKTRERSEHLAKAVALLEDKEFWEHQSAGLGLFIGDEGRFVPISIPVSVDSFAYVGQVFHVRHLVPGMGVARVPILLLTKNAVRLFYGTKHDIDEVDVDLPASIDDVNWFVDREKERQQHPDRSGSSRNRHGHEPAAREEEDRNRFLRAVSDALPGQVANHPLVVVGDDDLVERFRNLVDFETVSPRNSGVSAPQDDAMILERAMPALEGIETSRESEALKRAIDRLGSGRASQSIGEAIPAAVSGRVDEVVISRGAAPVWGHLDATSMTVEIRDEATRPYDVDLLDRLVVEAYKTGARISTVGDPIESGDFIAVNRY